MEKRADTSPEQERRAHLAAIVDSSDDAIVGKDMNGIITSWNAGAERLYGYAAEEAIGRPVSILVPEDRPEELAGIIERIRRGERVEHHETVCVTKDGRRVNVSLTVSPIKGERGRTLGFSSIARDITERLRMEEALQESEEQLRLAKAAGGIGIHDFNPSTGAISWDARTREFWGFGEDEPVTYKAWLEGIHPDDREAAEAAVVRSLDPQGEGVYLAEYRVVNRQDGSIRWLQVTGHATFLDGTPVRLVGTVHDITERKRSEEELREADRRKDEFLAILSHELRTPLAAIHGAASVLRELEGLPERGARVTKIIDRQVSQLVRLIDDLLDVTRITRGKMQLERRNVDVSAIVREVADDFRASCEQDELELSVAAPEEPVVVEADAVRFAQVINNLLSNACRFTPRGGGIAVTVEREDDQVEVRVSDTGVGMTREELGQVFDMFVQASNAGSARTKGLGIGLPLARSIMELHGGTIEASSPGPGKGSEFRVRLLSSETRPPDAERPRRRATRGDQSPPSSEDRSRGKPGSTPDAERHPIVVAEDSADALYALTLLLRMSGHEVVTAEDGSQALEKLREHRPRIALLDIDMPGMDGYEVARRIREEAWGGEVLLIAMTGWGQAKDKRRALDAGFDIHMTKPVNPEELRETLRARR